MIEQDTSEELSFRCQLMRHIQYIVDSYLNEVLVSYGHVHESIKSIASASLKELLQTYTLKYRESLSKEQALLKAHRKKTFLRFLFAILACLEIGTMALTGVGLIDYWSSWDLFRPELVKVVLFGLFTLLVLLAYIIVATLRRIKSYNYVPNRKRIHRLAFNDLDEELENKVSLCLNESLSRLIYSEESVAVSVGSSKLVESSKSKIVRSKAILEVCDFIESHTTSALGVCGPRGIGKSTTLREIANKLEAQNCVVKVSIPIRYETDAMVRRLLDEFIRQAKKIDSNAINEERWNRLTLQISKNALPVSIALVSMMLGVRMVEQSDSNIFGVLIDLNISGLLGGALIGFGLMVTGRVCMRYLNDLPVFQGGGRGEELNDAYSLAAAEERLNWSQERSRENGFETHPFTKLLSLNRKTSTKHVERPFGLQDLSLVFRRTVDRFIRDNEGTLVVFCVDELDKIEHSQGGLQIVNELKDLMHLPNTHFVLSVSSDALESFALRGIPVRDAIDSTFDEILELSCLDVEESWQVLRSRVPEFPPPLARFCHVWSLGNPRELLRTARNCIKIMNDRSFVGNAPRRSLGWVVKNVVYRDVDNALRVFLKKESVNLEDCHKQIMRSALESEDIRIVYQDVRKVVFDLSGVSKMRWESMIQWLDYAESVIDEFGSPATYDSWLRRIETGELDETAAQLVRRGLSRQFWGC